LGAWLVCRLRTPLSLTLVTSLTSWCRPYLCDIYGRRIAIIAGCLFLFVGVAIQSASQNFSMFIAGRFFVGFGNSMASNSAPLLLTELCHPQHRGRVTTVYNQLWDIGSIAATWITFGTFTIKNNWSWRIPSIFQAFPTLILFCCIWFIPESPRFLMSKDRHAEALATLAKYHANGDESDLTVQFEYREIKETLRLEFQAKKSSSFLDFLRTRGNRYRLLLIIALGLFSQWSGNVGRLLPVSCNRGVCVDDHPGVDQLLLRTRYEEHWHHGPQ
jgi:MFS family permease